MRGTCRIEIEKHPLGPGLLRDGSPAEIRGETESLALTSALVYLESRFGALSEYVHACAEVEPRESGPPVAIDRV